MAPKVGKNLKFTKDQEVFENWTVDSAQYAFHENCLCWQNFSNLRISKPPSKKI